MPDRLTALVAETQPLNGIDFVEIVTADQCTLRIHFLNTIAVDGTLTGAEPVRISGGEAPTTVPVLPVASTNWGVDDSGRPVLTLRTPFRGDFSLYGLQISSTALDPYYATIRFTFKAGCPSTLDCAPACAPVDYPAGGPRIDYLAKDFDSFRRALLEYSTTAYPAWVERDEPDVGMMLVELLSAAGDNLSYLQDRIAAEASLQTATERVSVLRHARLVDYEPSPAVSASALMQVDVAFANLPVGIVVEAPLPDGGLLPFELTPTLVDRQSGELWSIPLRVDPRWNRHDRAKSPGDVGYDRIVPYLWDDSQACLPAGSTQMWVRGHGFAFPVGDPQLGTVGLAMLVDTEAATAADAPVREVVHLTAADQGVDPLFGVEYTLLKWDATEALRFDHPLERTVLAGNLVPAVQGRRHVETFVVDPDPSSTQAPLAAVTRTGPDAGCGDPAAQHSHTLTSGALAWLEAENGSVQPEIHVVQRPAEEGDVAVTWLWRRRLLDADPFEAAYTVDSVSYRDIRPPRVGAIPWWEYDGDGDSIRFGEGTFGQRPVAGSAFDVTYRVTAGSAGNVAADSIVAVPPAFTAVIYAATNPFPSRGGAEQETIDSVRAEAPRAFRARQFRALRAEDYDQAAAELDWVLDAGTAMRWTGSWLTVFTTAQPATTPQMTLDEHTALIELLDRRRIAGYEVFAPDPKYVYLDLVVTVCAHAWAFRGEVEAAVLVELGTRRRVDGGPAFFAPGRMRFGTPLERSEFDAAIQRAGGVEGVVAITYRRRGFMVDYADLPETVTVGRDEIVRVDNDLSEPAHGSIQIVVQGGK